MVLPPSYLVPAWLPHSLLPLDRRHSHLWQNFCPPKQRPWWLDPLQEQPTTGWSFYHLHFIILVDVLQQMILKATNPRRIACAIRYTPDLPPFVLQYMDEPLIIAHASSNATLQLKHILDDFVPSTRLNIKLCKRMFVSLHVDSKSLPRSPKPLLVPPLTSPKLTLSYLSRRINFQPIIRNCMSYLLGWCAKLLSHTSRLVLVSSVLDSLATYFMSVLNFQINDQSFGCY